MSEKIKCTVHIATHEQLDWLCENKWNKSEALPKNLPQRICYVAEGEDGELLADLLICEHNAVGSLGGKDWRIVSILVFDPANRRRGIGTALFSKVLDDANAQGVRHLSGMVSKTSATRFWHKMGFSFLPWGRPIESPDSPDTDGNVQHIMVRRTDGKSGLRFSDEKERCDGLLIRRIEPQECGRITSELFEKTKSAYWKEKEFVGLIAERDGKTVGYVLAEAVEMGAPLVGVEWGIPAGGLYFEEDIVADMLLECLAEEAGEKGVMQLAAIVRPRENAPLWERRGFMLFDYAYLSEQNEFMTALCPISTPTVK